MTNHSETPYTGKPDPRGHQQVPPHRQPGYCRDCHMAPCQCTNPTGRNVRYATQEERGTLPPNGPRVTPEDIDLAMETARSVRYHHFPGTTVVACCVTLDNGFSVVGTAAAVSEENFDYDIGCRVAQEKVADKLWELLGFRLKQALYDGPPKAKGSPDEEM